MDDDSCILNYIEIVPVDDYRNCTESPGVKLSPSRVKVCMLFILCLLVVNYMICLSVVQLLYWDVNTWVISYPKSRSANPGTRSRLDLDGVSTHAFAKSRYH